MIGVTGAMEATHEKNPASSVGGATDWVLARWGHAEQFTSYRCAFPTSGFLEVAAPRSGDGFPRVLLRQFGVSALVGQQFSRWRER